jgi:hypothetical protein
MRRRWLAAIVAVYACGSPAPLVLPEAAGEWRKLGGDREVGQPDIAPEIHKLGLREARQADYAAPSGARVRLFAYRMRAGAAAFELVQRWRAAPGRFAFSAGDLFCEVRSEASFDGLAGAAAAFESALQEASK